MGLLKLSTDQIRKVKLGLVVVAVLALLVLAFFAGSGYQKRVPSESEKYLQAQIEEYRREIEGWRERFNQISLEKSKLEQSVQDLENQIETVRNYYDEKIITVKSYSNPELEQFFTDRYPD